MKCSGYLLMSVALPLGRAGKFLSVADPVIIVFRTKNAGHCN